MTASLGKLIQEAREKADLTQEELAVKIGMTQQSVSRWEAEKIGVPTDRLQAIARATGADLDALLAAAPGNRAKVRRDYQTRGEMIQVLRESVETLTAMVGDIEGRLTQIEDAVAPKAKSKTRQPRRRSQPG